MGKRVVYNLMDVIVVNSVVWNEIVWLTLLQILLFGWLIQHLVDPIILNLLVSRKFFLQEDHRVHLKIQLSALRTFFLLPEVIATELKRNQIRTILVFFKCLEFFYFSNNLLLCCFLCNFVCFKFYFFDIAAPWAPSLITCWFILLEVLFD